jgi:hypothetical protein
VFDARKQVGDLLHTFQSRHIHDRGPDRLTLLEAELLDKGVAEGVLVDATAEVESVRGVREESRIEVDLATGAEKLRAELDGLVATEM